IHATLSLVVVINASTTEIQTLSLHDALPISDRLTIIRNFLARDKNGHGLGHECIILGHCSSYLSNNVANPSPPPMPSVARPRFFPVLFISVHNRVTRTAPDAP